MIHVRLADEEALPACFDIIRRAQAEATAWAAPEYDTLDAFVASCDGEALMVATDHEPRTVGFASVWAADRFLHHLYVTPAAQGAGAGRALVEAALAWFGPLKLKCLLSNNAARSFYKRLGWRERPAEEADADWVWMDSPDTET